MVDTYSFLLYLKILLCILKWVYPYLPFLVKLEAGILAFKLVGKDELYTYIVSSMITLIPLLIMFGTLEGIIRLLKGYVIKLKNWKLSIKVIDFFRASNNGAASRNFLKKMPKKIKKFIIKRHFTFYFVFSFIPFVPYLTETCVVAAKVSKDSTKKGYACIVAGHFVKVFLTVKIIYQVPWLFEKITGLF